MRLIDADGLEAYLYNYMGYGTFTTEDFLLTVSDIYTIEIGRDLIPCGKCIHADGKHRRCKILDKSINEDYFCCWAEPIWKEGDK